MSSSEKFEYNKIVLDVITECERINNFNFNIKSKDDCTYLEEAIYYGLGDVALKLIELNVKFNQHNIFNTNAIWCACKMNLEDVFIKLFKRSNKINFGIVIEDATPLIWACYNKMETAALLLIGSGHSNPSYVADGSSFKEDKDKDAFYYAYTNKMNSVMYQLLKTKSINVTFRSKNRESVIHYVISTNYEILENVLFKEYYYRIDDYVNDITTDFTSDNGKKLLNYILKNHKKIKFKITNPKLVFNLLENNCSHLLSDEDLKYS